MHYRLDEKRFRVIKTCIHSCFFGVKQIQWELLDDYICWRFNGLVSAWFWLVKIWSYSSLLDSTKQQYMSRIFYEDLVTVLGQYLRIKGGKHCYFFFGVGSELVIDVWARIVVLDPSLMWIFLPLDPGVDHVALTAIYSSMGSIITDLDLNNTIIIININTCLNPSFRSWSSLLRQPIHGYL